MILGVALLLSAAVSTLATRAIATKLCRDSMVIATQLTAERESEQRKVKKKLREIVEGLAESFQASAGALVSALLSAAATLKFNAETMARATESTGKSALEVKFASEQTFRNVSDVAQATEELSAAIGEIDKKFDRSIAISETAVAGARRADATVAALVTDADKVGEVVQLIKHVAALCDDRSGWCRRRRQRFFRGGKRGQRACGADCESDRRDQRARITNSGNGSEFSG